MRLAAVVVHRPDLVVHAPDDLAGTRGGREHQAAERHDRHERAEHRTPRRSTAPQHAPTQGRHHPPSLAAACPAPQRSPRRRRRPPARTPAVEPPVRVWGTGFVQPADETSRVHQTPRRRARAARRRSPTRAFPSAAAARVSARRRRSDVTLAAARIHRGAVAVTALIFAALLFEAVLFAFGLATGSLALPSTIVYDAVFVAAALLCALRALARPTERLAWALMACAIACWATRRALLRRVSRHAHPDRSRSRRSPTSSGCSFYIPAYGVGRAADPLASAAPVREPVARRADRRARRRLGLGRGGLRHGAPPHDTAASAWSRPDSPIRSAISCCSRCWSASASRRAGQSARARSWLLIGLGFAVFCVGDSVYLLQTANNTYLPDGMLDMTWPIALALVGCAAWVPSRPPPVRPRATVAGEHRHAGRARACSRSAC